MMSGPAPVFAATAAFGRTSSQLSLSTFTSMPYFLLNASTFFMYWSMSPCTKRLQRSTRSLAPFSGVLFHWACASFTQISGPTTAPAATVEPVLMNLRRFTFAIVCLLRGYLLGAALLRQCRARFGIEQMRARGRERNLLADAKAVPLA